MQEREIERLAVKQAKKAGWESRKLSWIGVSGAPDRLFARRETPTRVGRIVFIEFKQLGKKPTLLQADEIKFLKESGAEVYVCDSVESAMEALGINKRYNGDVI